MRRLLVGLAGATALATAGGAAAHSLLLEASPAPTERVRAPGQLLLRFNNRVERRLSRLRLVGDGGDRLLLASDGAGPPDRLIAPLPPLAPGAYQVEWQVLSADGHVVSGRYTFHVVR